MEFPRGPNGLLGFGINEVGVVQKVDGLARSVGLQKNSRLLQVSVGPRVLEFVHVVCQGIFGSFRCILFVLVMLNFNPPRINLISV